MIGRFAPSPTGPLHVGNLRTALVAWLCARRSGGQFLVRFEDLDRANSSADNERRQLSELKALGIDHDGSIIRQSERFEIYRAVFEDLHRRGLVYPCYCSRREIREAVSAPHGVNHEGAYAGTCRALSVSDRAERERAGRPPAWRLKSDGRTYLIDDILHGPTPSVAGDIVLLRNDGVPAYNLAVVVDDAEQGITQVVRGADLLPVTGSQMHLQSLLGFATPQYVHVPLVHGPDGDRLAKRHGAVTLEDLDATAVGSTQVLTALGESLGCTNPRPRTAADLIEGFELSRIPRTSWTVPERWQTVP